MSYVWQDGEIITAEKLNNTGNIENANNVFIIQGEMEEDQENDGHIININKTYNEIKEAYDNNKILLIKMLQIQANEQDNYYSIFSLNSINESIITFFDGLIMLNINNDDSINISYTALVNIEQTVNDLDNIRYLQEVGNNIRFSYSGVPTTGSYLTCNQEASDIFDIIFNHQLSTRAFFNNKVYELIEISGEGVLAFQHISFNYSMPGFDGPYVIISKINYLESQDKWVYGQVQFELKNNS